ncbi:STAS domain-containing protein [Rubrobacter aplysinae]|uniref:STAS domain-containing protein n=1 Tax=Rubrobacter aplysinae TaxID=909625 RepID=UPI00069DCFD9|nr:STAS domain-containing protein [Rubrobacter aplysinae]
MGAETETNDHLSRVETTGFSAPVGRVADGSPVVEVRGEVDLATVPELLRGIGVACSRLDGQPVAYVDLREAEFIDVYGVRTLVEQAQAMWELGGELRLVVPQGGPVTRAFGLLEVERVLELYHDTVIPGGPADS